MKAPMKKSLVLIGITLFFVLLTLAENPIRAWDKNVTINYYCINGYFQRTGETATTFYGYCVCAPGYWGERCEFKVE